MTPDTLKPVSPNQPKTPLHSFRYPEDKWAAVKSLAAERGETITDVIARALDAYLEDAK